MKEKAIDFVTRMGWQYKIVSDGKEIQTGCPFKNCPNHGEPQFYISTNGTGSFYCQRCNEKGRTLRTLELKLGLLKPLQPALSASIAVSNDELDRMSEALLANKQALDYLINERAFTKATIIQFRLGFKVKDGKSAIVIPYFDLSNICVGLKYYFYDSFGENKCYFEKNSQMILFNVNSVNLKGDILITEGEFDAISAWQYGFTNVVSVPTGVGSSGEYLEDIRSASKILIAYDNESSGTAGANKLAGIVGASKCFRVYLPFKDFNECLQIGIELSEIEKVITNARPMFKAPIMTMEQLEADMTRVLENPELMLGQTTSWKSVDEFLGGIRMGEVTSFSGITSHGKTSFSLALACNLMRNDTNVLIISPEMRETDLMGEVVSNYLNKKVRTSEEVSKILPQIKDKLFIANVFNEWTTRKTDSVLDRIFDILEFAVKYKGVKFVILDHLRLFLDSKKTDEERLSIENFIKSCVKMAISLNIHIWLIVQPRKQEAGQTEIEMADLKGSSNIEQDSSNVVLIHRVENGDPGLVRLKFPKVRSTSGQIGSCLLRFNLESRANYEELI